VDEFSSCWEGMMGFLVFDEEVSAIWWLQSEELVIS
jgi:hypothetical protein